jgi:hypothetical protein
MTTYKATATHFYNPESSKHVIDKGEVVTVKQPEGQQIVTVIKANGAKITMGWAAYCFVFEEL